MWFVLGAIGALLLVSTLICVAACRASSDHHDDPYET